MKSQKQFSNVDVTIHSAPTAPQPSCSLAKRGHGLWLTLGLVLSLFTGCALELTREDTRALAADAGSATQETVDPAESEPVGSSSESLLAPCEGKNCGSIPPF